MNDKEAKEMEHSKLSRLVLAAVLLLALSVGLVQAQSPDPEIGALQLTTRINGQRAWQFTRYLASDRLQGRLAGTEGEYLAAEYISQKFLESYLLACFWDLMLLVDSKFSVHR